MAKRTPLTTPPICLVCGVDSGPIKVFLAAFIGSLVLASICFLVWAFMTKRLNDDDSNGRMALEAEENN